MRLRLWIAYKKVSPPIGWSEDLPFAWIVLLSA